MKNILAIIAISIAGAIVLKSISLKADQSKPIDATPRSAETELPGGIVDNTHPLQIAVMRQAEYPGSEITVEQELSPGSNYSRQIVSYKSEGLKQYALLTIPAGNMPEGGWPAIVFNHGYIPPNEYKTTEKYLAYTDGFSRNGFVLIRPDYRGHGNSEGRAEGGYGSPAYTIDVLNALASLKKLPEVDPDRIGLWGHSMGGHITLRAMVIDPTIKAGVIWGGVVGSYQDYSELWWSRRSRPTPTASPSPGQRGYWRQSLYETQGTFEENPKFWDSISATSYLEDISGPIQLHHAKGDETVPYELSVKTQARMEAAGKESELYLYEGDNHNISANFGSAMSRSVEFFQQYL